MTTMLCRKCGSAMTEWAPGAEYHVGCFPDFEKMPGFDMTGYDLELREDLTEVVLWASRNSQRSKQVALGVSEVGNECDLRIAYKMAGTPYTSNSPDPWPSIVGTSIHSWMEQAVTDFQAVNGVREWLTELEVAPSPLVQGHTDLYHVPRKAVLDWKFPSPDNLKKMRQEGPSFQYRVQVHLYGLGHLNAGRPVERVGIVALGRQGWLKDMYVWTEPFDVGIAEAALKRVYDIGATMIDKQLPESGRWGEIPRTPTRLCSWCPWFSLKADQPTERGCPGHKK